MKPIKAYLNVLKMRINMRLKRTILNTYPVIAFIDPATSYCPLQCPGCPTGLRLGLRKPHMLEWELYKCLIDEIGDYLFLIGLYNWGEPLLHKQTPEFIRYAKFKDITVWLDTNLSTTLSDEYIYNLVKSGLDGLNVSVDGATQETYEKYRRGGELSLVRSNLQRIQAQKRALGSRKPEIIWKFLVFQHNEHEITTVKATYKDWGADRVSFMRPFMAYKMLEEGFEYSSVREYASPEAPSVAKVEHRRTPRPCTWLYYALTLNSDGSVSPCCGIEDRNDDFAEYSPSRGFFSAWNSHKFRAARSLLAKPDMLSSWQDKPGGRVVNACQKCQAQPFANLLQMPEMTFREFVYQRTWLFLHRKGFRYWPDFLLTLLISDYLAAIRNPRQLIAKLISMGK